ncbi:uncharacterized protein LOC129573285 [Sitodiplosis mosellana]|uniref:uncharacterized protein LOC129573285 n=1 Tax=Sitodiplosis mosellana TaxID=263140 RepID=UPI002444B559|nr:uncharacterized protein LOC129573285 [Sitodiplosis mosellana]
MEHREALGEKVDAKQVADALIRLMPCITMESLYMPGCKKGKNADKEKDASKDNEVGIVEKAFQKLSLEEELACLAYYKTCIVERDKEILKIKMKQSIYLREKVIRKRETKFVESFPFYFVSPDLILYDFEIRFAGGNHLLEKWPKLQLKLLSLLNKKEAEECADFGFDGMMTSFFILLRALSMKKSFATNVDKLIVYSDNINGSPDNLIVKKNIHPYIIAVGPKKNDISNYYIDVEEHLIPIPNGFNSLKVIDMLFKCHKVFHLQYNPAYVKLMHFIDYFVFDDKENAEIDVTVSMRKISEKLNVSELNERAINPALEEVNRD